MQVATIGLDLAKHWFQVHGVDAAGAAILRKCLKRAEVIAFFQGIEPCLVGMEACASSHYWAREIARFGHTVRLMPPAYVKPYVKRGKNDAADAEAICEAVTRPTMRFVAVKTPEQQGLLMLHRARRLLVRQRTMTACAIRSHLAEFGFITGQGIGRVEPLLERLAEEEGERLPGEVRDILFMLAAELATLGERIAQIEARIDAQHRANPVSRLIATIPGIGPITATAIAATVPDATAFRSGRDFAAWLGLTPRQNSSGGKDRLGSITKRGDTYLRHLLFIGARNVIRYPKAREAAGTAWIEALVARRSRTVAAVALANKMARIAWAMMTTGEVYRSAREATA
ncbi:IS110 family transposase [Pseudoroseomonas wenyumeiae]|uniref:IS110 family transposase n=1 Tax=Teichococcus wenyumeiae TaxID=2478470 RepID=A0A3A9J5Z8_9PROT|nr:IS110 family transposase [Pseudoroseomonas wenyumeiae]RMI13987.1 IS110 family transposase [Pseudoroseomonas wenyumeiae]